MLRWGPGRAPTRPGPRAAHLLSVQPSPTGNPNDDVIPTLSQVHGRIMRDATVMLVSTNSVLSDAVHEVVGSVPKLRTVVVPGIDEALTRLDEGDVAVALLHLTEDEGLDVATRWLREVAALRCPVATLVVSDSHKSTQALSLLRLGAADYLSRPLDLTRLA